MITEKDIDKIALKVLDVLDKNEVLNKKKLSSFQKVEKILYNFDLLKNAVITKEKMIKELKNNPVLIKNNVQYENVQGGSKKYEAEIEKIESKIIKYTIGVEEIKILIDITERALKTIVNDKYSEIIKLRYFKKKNFEVISEELGISVVTAKRNRNLLIKKIELMIFSNDFVKMILF